MSEASYPVKTGLEIACEDGFSVLRGKRVGVICNHTAIDRNRQHLLSLLLESDITVQALFSPEHGFSGTADRPVETGSHEETGLTIFSLFGEQYRPTPEMLRGLDVLVYDIADVGVRFYTYTTTMTHCMEAAAEAGIGFVVLDRPNPIRGDIIEGPLLDKPFSRLSSWHPLPLRHGLTSGELARWALDHYNLALDLQVIRCTGWQRGMWLHETGMPWINPSPNLRTPLQVLLYPCVGMLEACNISVGRGTDNPFELIGAPWMDGCRLADALRETALFGLHCVPVEFIPTSREFAGERCSGVWLGCEDWNGFAAVEAGITLALTLRRLWPQIYTHEKLHHLLGSMAAVEAIGSLQAWPEIEALWSAETTEYAREVKRFWLYPQ